MTEKKYGPKGRPKKDVNNETLVVKIQEYFGLQADGWAGPKTENALFRALNAGTKQEPTNQIFLIPAPSIHKLPDHPQYGYKEHIGDDPALDTISKSGCLLCCIADILATQDQDIGPFELSCLIHERGGFTPESLLKWKETITELEFLTNQHWVHIDTDEPFSFPRCAEYLQAGIYPILHVSGSTVLKSHYVIAAGIEGKDVIIRDPGTGGSGGPKRDRLFGSLRKFTPRSFKILTTKIIWEAFQDSQNA